MAKGKMKREYVVWYAEDHDDDYGRCVTCKHYDDTMTCGECYEASRYCFDWRYYYEQHKEEIDKEWS